MTHTSWSPPDASQAGATPETFILGGLFKVPGAAGTFTSLLHQIRLAAKLPTGSTRPDGPVAKAIEKRGEGIHHVAVEVDDIRVEMARLKAEGFTLLSDEPKPGADNKLVCFVHPRDANGVLVELTQEAR